MSAQRDMKSVMAPRVNINEKKTAAEVLPPLPPEDPPPPVLKRRTLYLNPDHITWLKYRAVARGENVSRLLYDILEEAIASGRYNTTES
ncbi:ParB [Mycobacterium phage Echild]|uniref:ParB n=1 Tax=Mycobacterium phage Echild TaxID=1437839 RepID=UPI0003E369BE|nr:ParB [Mycobacterium phage Echild]AHG24256.1 ParB [Mycobacterium phage Echild]